MKKNNPKIYRTQPDIRLPGVNWNETWNTCMECGLEWKDAQPTPGLLHKTCLCYWCLIVLSGYDS